MRATASELASLLPCRWEEEHVRRWLEEDISVFDFGGYVVGEGPVTAQLLCKSSGIIAGQPFFEAIFVHLGCRWGRRRRGGVCGAESNHAALSPVRVQWHCKEGTEVKSGELRKIVATVKGPANRVLQGERPALNLIARLSGIATRTDQVVRGAGEAGFAGAIAGSRKTTPGLRMMEKYALLVGGADPHRLNLSTSVMLKDNHVDIVGSIGAAIKRARAVAGFTQKIEVEARSVEQAVEAASEGADIVMLDNFEPMDAKLAAQKIKQRMPHVIVEASGGMDAQKMKEYFCPWIDLISMGGHLTQNVASMDFSLKIAK